MNSEDRNNRINELKDITKGKIIDPEVIYCLTQLSQIISSQKQDRSSNAALDKLIDTIDDLKNKKEDITEYDYKKLLTSMAGVQKEIRKNQFIPSAIKNKIDFLLGVIGGLLGIAFGVPLAIAMLPFVIKSNWKNNKANFIKKHTIYNILCITSSLISGLACGLIIGIKLPRIMMSQQERKQQLCIDQLQIILKKQNTFSKLQLESLKIEFLKELKATGINVKNIEGNQGDEYRCTYSPAVVPTGMIPPSFLLKKSIGNHTMIFLSIEKDGSEIYSGTVEMGVQCPIKKITRLKEDSARAQQLVTVKCNMQTIFQLWLANKILCERYKLNNIADILEFAKVYRPGDLDCEHYGVMLRNYLTTQKESEKQKIEITEKVTKFGGSNAFGRMFGWILTKLGTPGDISSHQDMAIRAKSLKSSSTDGMPAESAESSDTKALPRRISAIAVSDIAASAAA